jgi:hypothetical protein
MAVEEIWYDLEGLHLVCKQHSVDWQLKSATHAVFTV